MKTPGVSGARIGSGEKPATEPMPSTIELAETLDLGGSRNASDPSVPTTVPGPLDLLSGPPSGPDEND